MYKKANSDTLFWKILNFFFFLFFFFFFFPVFFDHMWISGPLNLCFVIFSLLNYREKSTRHFHCFQIPNVSISKFNSYAFNSCAFIYIWIIYCSLPLPTHPTFHKSKYDSVKQTKLMTSIQFRLFPFTCLWQYNVTGGTIMTEIDFNTYMLWADSADDKIDDIFLNFLRIGPEVSNPIF